MRHPRFLAALSCTALFVLAWLLPTSARAQAHDESWSRLNVDLCNTSCERAATVGFGLPVVVFAVADIAYASQGSWLPRGLAYAQLSLGVTAGVVGALGLTARHSDPRLAMLLAAGALLSAGGILSLALYERPDADPTQRARLHAALVPMPHGFWTGLSAQL
jgi:hypothetical protein